MRDIFYTLYELIFSEAYKKCLMRDLYLLAMSDGVSQLREDRFMVSAAEENVSNSILIEVQTSPLAIRDCYPNSTRKVKNFIYLMTSMLLIEGDCSDAAITHYKHSMYKLGLDDADIVQVVVALGQSNPKFQSAAISYFAKVDTDTLTQLAKRKNRST